jgi:hypothetical protein
MRSYARGTKAVQPKYLAMEIYEAHFCSVIGKASITETMGMRSYARGTKAVQPKYLTVEIYEHTFVLYKDLPIICKN